MGLKDLKENAFDVFPEDLAVAYRKTIANALGSHPRIGVWVAGHRSGELVFSTDAKAERAAASGMTGRRRTVSSGPERGIVIREDIFPSLWYSDEPIKEELLINLSPYSFLTPNNYY
jgi:hypothetical protein